MFHDEIDKSLLVLYSEGKISLEVYRYYSRLLNLVEIAQIQRENKIDLRQIGFKLTN